MERLLFWITIATCLMCVQMAVWEPLLILNVTGNTSVSPLDIWNDLESRQQPQDITTEDWIRNGNLTSSFVSDRISHWDIAKPDMLEVQAVNFKHNDVQIVQSVLFNTTTSNFNSLDDWMKGEYLSNQNRTMEAIETPTQLQSQNALFRYNYTSNGTIGKITKGGMTFLLDTRNVSERGSLLLTSNVRNIGDVGDVLFNLNTHTYQSLLNSFEEVLRSNIRERISSRNHKIVRRVHQTGDRNQLVLLRFEMEEGVVVKTLSVKTSGSFVVSTAQDDGSQSSEIVRISRFYKDYNKRILNMEIIPAYDISIIDYMEVVFTYTYLPYDVADYFVIRGRFATCDEPPNISNTVIEGTGTTAGSSRTYTCTTGTSVVSGSDPATSHCQSNGTWSRPNIQCLVDCGDALTIPNTELAGTGTVTGSYRKYICVNGSSLVSGKDRATSYCESGEWSIPNIRCEMNCGDPAGVPNTAMNGSGTTAGSARTYTCKTGTSLVSGVDPVTSYCQNGEWSRPNITCEVPPTTETGSTSITSIDTTSGTTEMTTSTTATALHTTPDTTTTVTSKDVTSDSIDTTTDQTADQNSDPNCTMPCSCKIAFWGNTTKLEDLDTEKLAELKTTITKLKVELTVHRTALSTYKATKVSASDEKRSAAGIGAVGVLIIILVVSLVIMADVMTCLPSRPPKKIQIA